MKRCDHCEHFDPNPPAEQPGEIIVSAYGTRGGGQCRRYPPRDEGEFQLARFRTVACDWWCGEFVPKDARDNVSRCQPQSHDANHYGPTTCLPRETKTRHIARTPLVPPGAGA